MRTCFVPALGFVLSLTTAGFAHAATVLFDTVGSGSFVVPDGVSALQVLVVGGGGGGANGHQGGGGAGDVVVSMLSVSSGQSIAYVVGGGGSGALTQPNNTVTGLTAGHSSEFGTLIATGGQVIQFANDGGHNGSSGGGAACNAGTLGGAGGSGGSNGERCQIGRSNPVGTGQGDYSAALAVFLERSVTAGAGGAGGTGSHAGGGGAGGVLIDGLGPVAGQGLAAFSALGGFGYGAGGGAGGLDISVSNNRFGGGDGAAGVILLQFEDPFAPPVPLPATGLLLLGGLGVLSAFGKRKQPG